MFEIIKVILETLGKLLNPSELSKLAKDKKRREIGAQLFLVYVYLNEVIVCGESIISSLEVYIERMQLGHAHALTGGSWVSFKLNEQRLNIARLVTSIRRLSRELQIVDGEAYRQLMPLVEGKCNAIDGLLRILGDERLPLCGPTGRDVVAFAAESVHTRDRSELRHIIDDFMSQLEKQSVRTNVPWNENIFADIKTYVAQRKPREQLSYMREVAEQLRKSLEKHFSLSDILLEVGDRKLSLQYNGEYFW